MLPPSRIQGLNWTSRRGFPTPPFFLALISRVGGREIPDFKTFQKTKLFSPQQKM
jgi:hypothetical protein